MVENQKEECLHCKKCCEPKWKQFVRPSTFILTLFIFFILMVFDGNWGEFHIRDIYLKILESILVTMVIALFASRGVEKTFGIIKDRDPNRDWNYTPWNPQYDNEWDSSYNYNSRGRRTPDNEYQDIPDIYKNNKGTNYD